VPKGRIRAGLADRGKAKLRLKITYRAKGNAKRTRTKTVKLIER
jgi:hypothetical protein